MDFQKDKYDNTDTVFIGDVRLDKIEELNALAEKDGFESWWQMKHWFENSACQFFGKIIFWNYAKCVFLALAN